MSSKPDHVGIFLPNLTVGGVERVITTLSHEFVSRGIQTDIVLVEAQGELLDQLPDGVSVVDLDCSRLRYSLPGVCQYLLKANPDVLLSAMNPPNIISLLATMITPVDTRCAISVHCSISPVYTDTESSKRKLILKGMKSLYNHSDQVITVSEGVAQDVSMTLGINRSATKVIYNPFSIGDIQSQSTDSVDHPWFNSNSQVVLSAGRLSPEKDFTTLLRAFHQVSQGTDRKLVILGDGKQRETLLSLAQDLQIDQVVDLPGYVENPYKYMRQADVFTLSSSLEGFGNVLVEAMAVGTPVVSTDCPVGPSEILEDGEWGSLVPVSDESALATAIDNTLANPPEREKLVERARDFDSETIAEEYVEVLFNPHDT